MFELTKCPICGTPVMAVGGCCGEPLVKIYKCSCAEKALDVKNEE